jgi:hyperosmotically inducible protein
MRIARLMLMFLVTGVCSVGMANCQQATPPNPPDNTGSNLSDQKAETPTAADQQKNNSPDIQTTRAIRRALMSDKNLSTYAHNVKIITQNGEVTLKGPVRSADERNEVQAKAAEIAGSDKITNQITVQPQE